MDLSGVRRTEMVYLSYLLVVVGLNAVSAYRDVIELDDRFLTGFWKDRDVTENPWLLEFYAPWCGHCKRLEPIYHQVALALEDQASEVKVAKIDATRFPELAQKYEVRGYPTIVFLRQGISKEWHHFRGDRTKDGILKFIRRADGPAIRHLTNIGKFNDARGDHFGEVFFMYIGPQDSKNEFFQRYEQLAKKMSLNSYFYSGEKSVLPADMALSTWPTLLVFKDGGRIELGKADEKTVEELEEWIRGEQYPAFPKVSGYDLNGMVHDHKIVVLVVTNDKDDRTNPRNERLKTIGETVATKHRDLFHENFQFAWMGDPESVVTLTMSRLKIPGIFALNASTQEYFIPEEQPEEITLSTFQVFLSGIKEGRIQPYGGTGFFVRLQRLFFDVYGSIKSVFDESVWLGVLVFGVPILVVGIVCYALCCLEPVDEEELFEELAQLRQLREEAELRQKLKEAGETGEPLEQEITDKTPLLAESGQAGGGHIKSE